MPDITMCSGKDCPLKDSCYRYVAPADAYRQSFFVVAPFIDEPDGTSCEYYWKAE